jgi:SAM-dependent methyltransferase
MKRPGPAEFDRYAQDYDALLRDPLRDGFAGEKTFFVERKLDVILKFLTSHKQDPRSLRWLDVGCGQGDLLRMGKSFFASVAGCDPSTRMLEACSGLDVSHQPDVASLPFADASFDFVTAVCVYHHVPGEERLRLTREICRVLRSGGLLCVIEHNPWNPVTRIIVSRTPIDADAELLTPARTRKLIASANASPVATEYFLLLPERLFRFLSFTENMLKPIPLGGQYAMFGRKP